MNMSVGGARADLLRRTSSGAKASGRASTPHSSGGKKVWRDLLGRAIAELTGGADYDKRRPLPLDASGTFAYAMEKKVPICHAAIAAPFGTGAHVVAPDRIIRTPPGAYLAARALLCSYAPRRECEVREPMRVPNDRLWALTNAPDAHAALEWQLEHDLQAAASPLPAQRPDLNRGVLAEHMTSSLAVRKYMIGIGRLVLFPNNAPRHNESPKCVGLHQCSHIGDSADEAGRSFCHDCEKNAHVIVHAASVFAEVARRAPRRVPDLAAYYGATRTMRCVTIGSAVAALVRECVSLNYRKSGTKSPESFWQHWHYTCGLRAICALLHTQSLDADPPVYNGKPDLSTAMQRASQPAPLPFLAPLLPSAGLPIGPLAPAPIIMPSDDHRHTELVDALPIGPLAPAAPVTDHDALVGALRSSSVPRISVGYPYYGTIGAMPMDDDDVLQPCRSVTGADDESILSRPHCSGEQFSPPPSPVADVETYTTFYIRPSTGISAGGTEAGLVAKTTEEGEDCMLPEEACPAQGVPIAPTPVAEPAPTPAPSVVPEGLAAPAFPQAAPAPEARESTSSPTETAPGDSHSASGASGVGASWFAMLGISQPAVGSLVH